MQIKKNTSDHLQILDNQFNNLTEKQVSKIINSMFHKLMLYSNLSNDNTSSNACQVLSTHTCLFNKIKDTTDNNK